jgi:coenzyme F420 hydrogenase subunit beta
MSTRLQQEVWALQRCSGCGVCVAACSKGVLYWDGEQHPALEERQKVLGLSRHKLMTCEVCEKFCELSCPRLVEWTPMEPRAMVSARSAGVVHSGAPNDVIQAVLVAGRSADLIDGVVMLDMDPWTLEPVARIATTVDEIVSSVGMQYLWAPVLSALNEAIFDLGLTRLAVVGSPCVAEGARRLMTAEHARLWPYQKAIRLTIASFCTGIYMPEMVTDLLERGMGIPRDQIRGIDHVGDGRHPDSGPVGRQRARHPLDRGRALYPARVRKLRRLPGRLGRHCCGSHRRPARPRHGHHPHAGR